MPADELVDLIFTGEASKVDFSFIAQFLQGASETRFNSHETEKSIDFEAVISLLKKDDYVDLVISTSSLKIQDRTVANVFINITLLEKNVELSLFFDPYDLGLVKYRDNIDILQRWSTEFEKQYHFDFVICHPDGIDELSYFDSAGVGKLYAAL